MMDVKVFSLVSFFVVLVLKTGLCENQCNSSSHTGRGKIMRYCISKRTVTHQLQLSCAGDKRIIIHDIVQRTSQRSCKKPEDCCEEIASHYDYYDIGRCFGNNNILKSLLGDLLTECNQKKYCSMFNEDGSSLGNLTDSIQEDKRTFLKINYDCEEGRTYPLCGQTSTEVSLPIYIGTPASTPGGQCSCSIQTHGSTNITLMDVKLGSDQGTSLMVRNATYHETFSSDDHPLIFNKKMPKFGSDVTLVLTAKVNRHPGNVFIKLEGDDSSPKAQLVCTVLTENLHSAEEDQDNRSIGDRKVSTFGTFLIGCATVSCGLGLVFLIFVIKKRKSRRRSSAVIYTIHLKNDNEASAGVSSNANDASIRREPSPKEDDLDETEHVYSLPQRLSCHGSFSTHRGSVSSDKRSLYATQKHVEDVPIRQDASENNTHDVADISIPLPPPRSRSRRVQNLGGTAIEESSENPAEVSENNEIVAEEQNIEQ